MVSAAAQETTKIALVIAMDLGTFAVAAMPRRSVANPMVAMVTAVRTAITEAQLFGASSPSRIVG